MTPANRPEGNVTRDWNVFFQKNAFNWPRNMQHWAKRLETNLSYFQQNYYYILGAALVFASLRKPRLILCYGMGSLGTKHIMETPVIKFWGETIPKSIAVVGLAGGLSLLCTLFAGSTFCYPLMVALLMVTLHATFRKRLVTAKISQWLTRSLGSMCEMDDEVLSDNDDKQAAKKR